jgi:hypothetical protein
VIIWLASYPRSGNSYFREICRTVYNVKSHSIYPEMTPHSGELDLATAASDGDQWLVKTHAMPDNNHAAIYLVRDGRDSLVSYAHWTLAQETGVDHSDHQTRAFQDCLKRIITTSRYFGGWSANVKAWLDRPSTHMVRFEDLIADPINVVGQALDEMGIHHQRNEKKEAVKFAELHKQDPVLYRKGVSGAWQAEMNPAMTDLFWQYHGAAMRRLGYDA